MKPAPSSPLADGQGDGSESRTRAGVQGPESASGAGQAAAVEQRRQGHGAPGERRRSPEDGQLYTWEEFERKCRGNFKLGEIKRFWMQEMLPADSGPVNGHSGPPAVRASGAAETDAVKADGEAPAVANTDAGSE